MKCACTTVHPVVRTGAYRSVSLTVQRGHHFGGRHKTHCLPVTTQDFLNDRQLATLIVVWQVERAGGNRGNNTFKLAMHQCFATN